jgi:hypothetical protein
MYGVGLAYIYLTVNPLIVGRHVRHDIPNKSVYHLDTDPSDESGERVMLVK